MMAKGGMAGLVMGVLMLLGACEDATPGGAYGFIPADLASDARVILYLPDRVRAGRTPAANVEALAGRGFVTIATERAPDVDDATHIVAIKERIRQLLARGVAPERIGLVGAGAGGRLALNLAYLVSMPEMGVVILGACPKPGRPDRVSLEATAKNHVPLMRGRVLSLAPADDRDAGPCTEILEAARGADTWEETLPGDATRFRQPDPAWLDHAAAWLKGE